MNRITPASAVQRARPESRQGAAEGRLGLLLFWLLGVPIPVLFLFFLLRGCT
ncbi:MAG: hypothetical protein ACREVL_08490 [Solimonas sp.]